MQRKLYIIFVLLPILFLFLPAFAFYVPFLHSVYLFFFLSIYFALFLMFTFDFKKNIKTLYFFFKKTPFKIFVFLLIFMGINAIILSFFHSGLMQAIRSVIMQLILCIYSVTLYFILTISNYLSLKKFIKIFIFLFWINLFVGFFAYIGQIFHLTIIDTLFNFFANLRHVQNVALGGGADPSNEYNYMAFGLPRLDNLFDEPGHYAQFLFLFLPLCYAIKDSKIKISNNKNLNVLIKLTIIPLTWISIILTFSPIFLVFSFLVTGIYYFKTIIKFIYDKLLLLILPFLIILFLIINIDFSNTYLSRIINVLTQIKSFEDFIQVEASLASRVCCYINSFLLFLKHPISGVGIGNVTKSMVSQFQNSPIPLTPEIIIRSNISLSTSNTVTILKGFIYNFLAENGLIGFIILTSFLYSLLKQIVKYSKIFSQTKPFAKGIIGCFIALFINAFYNLDTISIYIYIIFSLGLSYIYYCKQYRLKKVIIND